MFTLFTRLFRRPARRRLPSVTVVPDPGEVPVDLTVFFAHLRQLKDAYAKGRSDAYAERLERLDRVYVTGLADGEERERKRGFRDEAPCTVPVVPKRRCGRCSLVDQL